MLAAVQTVSIHHDWLDYLAAFGGLVGGIAALVALIFAALSKNDAERSAAAAEATRKLADEQVAITRREAAAAEAARSLRAAPVIQLTARAMLVNDIEPPSWVILTLGFLQRKRDAAGRSSVGELARARLYGLATV